LPLSGTVANSLIFGDQDPSTSPNLLQDVHVLRILREMVIVKLDIPPMSSQLMGYLVAEIPVEEEDLYAAGLSQNSYLSAS
jgi:hypothetical protein